MVWKNVYAIFKKIFQIIQLEFSKYHALQQVKDNKLLIPCIHVRVHTFEIEK